MWIIVHVIIQHRLRSFVWISLQHIPRKITVQQNWFGLYTYVIDGTWGDSMESTPIWRAAFIMCLGLESFFGGVRFTRKYTAVQRYCTVKSG